MSNNPKKKTNTSAQKGGGNKKQKKQKKKETSGNGKPIMAPIAVASRQSTTKPRITQGNGVVRVKHRELLANIQGSSDFELQGTFPLNPGSEVTFPWLSKVFGRGYEQYHIHECSFEYITRCGTSFPGSVALIPDYNSADAAPATEQIASTYYGMVEDAPWKNITLKLNEQAMAGGRTKHFVRNAALAPNEDIKSYDCGNVFIATNDAEEGGPNCGKIWINYDISFYVPRLPSNGSIDIIGGRVTGGGTMSPADPLGSNPTVDTASVGISTSTSGGDEVFINSEGDFMITLFLVGTGITDASINLGAGLSDLGVIFVPNAAGTALLGLRNVHIDPGWTTGTNFFDVVSTATTITSSNVYITRAPLGTFAMDLKRPKKCSTCC